MKTFGGDEQLKITTKYKIAEVGIAVDTEIQEKLFKGLQAYFPEGYTLEEFRNR